MAVREVDSSGTVSGAITVNKVNIGTAVAAYTTIPAAVTAASNGDRIVMTEDMDGGLTGTGYNPGKAVSFEAADNVRNTSGKYDGTGARVDYAYAFQFSAATTWDGIARGTGESTTLLFWQTTTSHGTRVLRTVMKKTANGWAYRSDAVGTFQIEQCMVELGDGGGIALSNNGGDFTGTCFNNTVVITNTTTTPAIGITGSSGVRRMYVVNNAVLLATGANAPSYGYYLNSAAHPSYTAGYNMSSGTDAPGTTVYNSVSASSVLANATPATLDMHWKDRTTIESYPGADVSASLTTPDIDVDVQSRGDEWFVGADWITGAVAAVAASSVGFFLMCPFGLLYGLQDE